MLRKGRNFDHKAVLHVRRAPSVVDAREKTSTKRLFQGKALFFLLFLILGLIYIYTLKQNDKRIALETSSANTGIDELQQPLHIASDPHLFDCTRQNATCQSFYPLHFFAPNQPGYAYLSSYQKLGGTLRNLPRMTHLTWSTSSSSSPFNITTDTPFQNLPSDITFFHIRKTGGTSIHHAIGHLSKYLKSSGVTSQVTRYSTCRGILEQKCISKANHHVVTIAQQQQQQNNHVVFAVVRDPLDRFVSAMGQAMEVGSPLRETCLDESSTQSTITCVLSELQHHGLKLNVHFVPMSITLHAACRKQELRVSLFHQDDLPKILSFLGSTNTTSMHFRNRSNQDYLKSKVLANLSVDNFTTAQVEEICKLYAVDVAFMESIGIEALLCTQ